MKPEDQDKAHEALRAYFDCGAELHCLLTSMGAEYPNHHVTYPDSGTRCAIETRNEGLLRRFYDAYMAWRTASLALLNPNSSEMAPAIFHRNTAKPSWYDIFRFPGPKDDGSRSRWDAAPPTPEELAEESAGEGTWVSILSGSGSGDITPPERTHSPELIDDTADEEKPLPDDAREYTNMEPGNVEYDPHISMLRFHSNAEPRRRSTESTDGLESPRGTTTLRIDDAPLPGIDGLMASVEHETHDFAYRDLPNQLPPYPNDIPVRRAVPDDPNFGPVEPPMLAPAPANPLPHGQEVTTTSGRTSGENNVDNSLGMPIRRNDIRNILNEPSPEHVNGTQGDTYQLPNSTAAAWNTWRDNDGSEDSPDYQPDTPILNPAAPSFSASALLGKGTFDLDIDIPLLDPPIYPIEPPPTPLSASFPQGPAAPGDYQSPSVFMEGDTGAGGASAQPGDGVPDEQPCAGAARDISPVEFFGARADPLDSFFDDPMDVDVSSLGQVQQQDEEEEEEVRQARSSSICSSEATLSPVPREWVLRRLSNDLRRLGSEVVAPRRRRY